MTSLTTVCSSAHVKSQNKWLSLIMDQRLRDELSSVIEKDDLVQLKQLAEKKPKLPFVPDDDGFSGFDLALILNRRKVLDWFLLQGATYSELLTDSTSLKHHVGAQLQQVASQIVSLTATVFRKGDGSGQLSGKSFAKTLRQLEVRNRRLKQVQLALDALAPAPAPTVQCTPWSCTSLRVAIRANAHDSCVTLFCRLQVSTTDFAIGGEPESITIKTTAKSVDYDLPRLQLGCTYFVRAQFFNLAGWGHFGCPQPPQCTLSSWRQLLPLEQLHDAPQPDCDALFNTFGNDLTAVFAFAARTRCNGKKKDPPAASNSGPNGANGTPSLSLKTIANSVYSAPKFTKSLKRGVFLAFVCYCDNKLLTTTDEVLPIVSVDEAAPTNNLEAEMQQLQKYMLDPAVLWLVTKCLSKVSLPASLELRFKLLNALVDFLHQLLPQIDSGIVSTSGQLDFVSCFFERVYANSQQDASVLVCCLHFYDVSRCNLASGTKWTHITKLVRKKVPAVAVQSEPSISSVNSSNSSNCERLSSAYEDEKLELYTIIVNSLPEMLLFTRQCTTKLPAGLHVAYLQARSSFTQMRVLATREPHGMLPATKVRECSHVSKEEFTYILERCVDGLPELQTDDHHRLIGRRFRQNLMEAIGKLAGALFASGVDAALLQEPQAILLYLSEIIELDDRTALLLLVPPPDCVCTMASFKWKLADCKSAIFEMSLNNFEFMSMQLYASMAQRRTVALFNASELAVLVMQHFQRSLMSPDDIAFVKHKVEAFQRMQTELEPTLKLKRWIVRIIAALRDRTQRSSLRLLPVEDLQVNRLMRSNTVRPHAPVQPSSDPSVRRRRRPSSVVAHDRLSASELNDCDAEEPRAPEQVDLWQSITNAAIFDFDTPMPTFGAKARAADASRSHSATPTPTRKVEPTNSRLDETEQRTTELNSVNASPKRNGFVKQKEKSRPTNLDLSLAGVANEQEGPSTGIHSSSKPNAENEEQTLRIRVRPAYDVGVENCSAITRGVKVLINNKTTARDVINVVVRYLNQYSHLHNPNAPCYSEDELRDFCLVIVSGKRERILRDDFLPLLLEHSLTDSHFYVRLRRDILAAFECGPETLV